MWNKKDHTENNSKLIEKLNKRFRELSSEQMVGDEGKQLTQTIIALTQSNVTIEFLIDALQLKEEFIDMMHELYINK
tara:strand:+ start:120 stop:350 length:231 start_codon:yes stop_codon:yes gene_type:complete